MFGLGIDSHGYHVTIFRTREIPTTYKYKVCIHVIIYIKMYNLHVSITYILHEVLQSC